MLQPGPLWSSSTATGTFRRIYTGLQLQKTTGGMGRKDTNGARCPAGGMLSIGLLLKR